jgi:Protein of unknown function (DUF2510)
MSASAGVTLLAGGLLALLAADPVFPSGAYHQDLITVASHFLYYLVVGALLVAVAFGYRWALYLTSAYCVVGFLAAPGMAHDQAPGDLTGTIWIWAAVAIIAAALVLLFAVKSSRAWFASQRPPRRPEAGWRSDPSGRHDERYWDGSAWTDRVADAGGIVPDLRDEPGELPRPQTAELS